MEGYRVVREVGDGLIIVEVIRVKVPEQLWVKGLKIQDSHRHCVICEKDLYHERSYRPTGNPVNRNDRLCEECKKKSLNPEIPTVGIESGKEGDKTTIEHKET